MRSLTEASPTAGFSLIELMVATSILALIAVALTGGLRLGVRAWESTHDRSAEFAAQLSFRTVLYDLLADARPIWRHTGSTDREFTFVGTGNELRFVTVMPEHLGGGLYSIRLSVERGGSGQSLTFQRRPFTLMQVAAHLGEGDEVRVVEGARSIAFTYFGVRSDGDAPAWRDEWHNVDRLPKLVRIAVALDPHQYARPWPPLIVQTRVTRHGA